MEFEIDPVQDGRYRLARRTLLQDAPQRGEQDHAAALTFALEGMAGAVLFSVILGNAQASRATRTIGWVDVENMFNVDIAPLGLEVHAYRPWPTGESIQSESPVLTEGFAYVQHLHRGAGWSASSELLAALTNGRLEAMWLRLDEIYRREFEAALAPADYADRQRREAALEAYERAAAGPEPVSDESAAIKTYAPTAPPYDGPRRWITCPECGSPDEATDTPCTNLACPSHARRGTRIAERIEAELLDPSDAP